VKANFFVKFADAKTPRTVTIRPSNIAHYVRDHDGLTLERFLLERGFIIRRAEEQEIPDENRVNLVGV
jgi:phage antirepressor YoqD-like protein